MTKQNARKKENVILCQNMVVISNQNLLHFFPESFNKEYLWFSLSQILELLHLPFPWQPHVAHLKKKIIR